MRKRIFEIIEVSNDHDKASHVYDVVMLVAIIVSMIPLMVKETNIALLIIDRVTVSLFVLDYILRLITADYKMKSKSVRSFIKYPFTPMALVDLISIVPSLITNANSTFHVFRIMRLLRTARVLRVFRIFKVLRYSKSVRIIMKVLDESKEALTAVCTLAIAYIFITALIIFNVEPDTFNTYFDAVYWATVSLTTMGYGDLYCVSVAGRVITMVSAIFGIAIVALPSGIITAGYMNTIQNEKKESDEK